MLTCKIWLNITCGSGVINVNFHYLLTDGQTDSRSDNSAHQRVILMPPKELWEAYSNRTVRPSVPLRVRCISPIFFEVAILNLVCGCILGWWSVAYNFRVTVTLTLTSDLVFIVITMSVRPASCPVHISYILWGRNSKFDMWMHLGMGECRVPFLGHCDLDLDLWPSFKKNCVRSISLILFEVGISNLVCGCILRKCRVP